MSGNPSSEFIAIKNGLPEDNVSDLDHTMLSFVRSWHRHPAVADLLWYRGINLGEMAEYWLIQKTVKALIDEKADRTEESIQGKAQT